MQHLIVLFKLFEVCLLQLSFWVCLRLSLEERNLCQTAFTFKRHLTYRKITQCEISWRCKRLAPFTSQSIWEAGRELCCLCLYTNLKKSNLVLLVADFKELSGLFVCVCVFVLCESVYACMLYVFACLCLCVLHVYELTWQPAGILLSLFTLTVSLVILVETAHIYTSL